MDQFLHLDGYVGEQFLVEPVAQIARRHPLAFAPGEGRRVDGESHGDGGLVDVDGRKRLRRFGVGHGLADEDALHPGDGQDVARPADGLVHALQPFEGIELGDFGGVEGAVALGDGHRVAIFQGSLEDAPNAQAAQVVAVIQVGDEHLQDGFGIARRRGNVLQDGVEERAQVGGRVVHGFLGHAGLGDGVEHRKIELVFGGVEIDEQVVNLVEHFRHARVGAVDLIDHHDGRQVRFQGLGKHVARLRQRTFAGVHEQHDAVDDLEGAFHLAAEIAMAGGVDDVDFDAVIAHAGNFGEDGDAALAFQVVGIHDAVDVFLVGAEDAALIEHGVDESGLAMVHVGDDGDVADAGVAAFHGRGKCRRRCYPSSLTRGGGGATAIRAAPAPITALRHREECGYRLRNRIL